MKKSKKKHPRLLALFKVIVAYKLTHNSDGHPTSGYQFCSSFIWWTASDAFIWCKDAWPITIQETPEFAVFRAYWTKDKLVNLWKKRLSHASKSLMIKEAIAALRKENKVVTAKKVWERAVWKRGQPSHEKKTETHWVYYYSNDPLTALAALGTLHSAADVDG